MQKKWLLGIILLLNLSLFYVLTGYADIDNDRENIQLSFKSVNSSFDAVLEKLTEATGYSIELQSGVEIKNNQFTFQLVEMTLLDALKKILRGYDNFLEIDEQQKHILIRIAPEKNVIEQNFYPPDKKIMGERSENMVVDDDDYEIVPPEEGETQGITRRELKLVIAQREESDPLYDEVVPPDQLGERGITRMELNELQKAMPQEDPLSYEVVPPDNPNERGISRLELNELQNALPQTNPLDDEVVPPDKPGEKGITRRQLNQLHEKHEND